VLSWGPIVYILAYGSYADVTKLNPIFLIVAILFAKSIVLWSPIFEILLNIDVRRNLFFYHKSEEDSTYENELPMDTLIERV
jgi:hypothetical protein